MEELLRSKGLRVTDFRLAVLGAFSHYKNAISIDLIEKALGDFDRITLYRTIKSFKEKGIIHEISLPDDIKKLALCDPECMAHDEHHHHEHVHFQCDNCHEVFCVEVPTFPKLGLKGFVVDHMEIQVFGTCSSCS